MRNANFRNRNLTPRVPVQIDGKTTGLVAISDIKNWNDAHGTTRAGVQVNSAAFAKVGGSIVIKGADGHCLSIPLNDAEVLAGQMNQYFEESAKTTRQAA